MKIYCLISTDTFEDDCNVTGKLFLDRDSAMAAMVGQYESMLESLCMEKGGNGSDHYCNREQASACIVDDTSIYTWSVKEFEQDIRIAVEVKDGLVQNIYANAGVSAEVYDLDLTDVEKEGGPTEGELRQAALAEEISAPGWRTVW